MHPARCTPGLHGRYSVFIVRRPLSCVKSAYVPYFRGDGDIIVAVDGDSTPRNESEFMEHVRLRHPPGDKVKLTILRGTDRREVEMEVE